jgi:hypothetical protein
MNMNTHPSVIASARIQRDRCTARLKVTYLSSPVAGIGWTSESHCCLNSFKPRLGFLLKRTLVIRDDQPITNSGSLRERRTSPSPTAPVQPHLVLAFKSLPVSRYWHSLFPTETHVKWFESDRASAFFDTFRMLDQVRPKPPLMVGLKLGAVKLGSTFEHSNAVFQHRRLRCWQVARIRSLLQ